MSKGKTESLPKSLTFEKALERLQEIVAELEDPEKGPRGAASCSSRRGSALSRFCRSRIDEIQKRVEVVLKETPDALVTEPLDDELDEDALDGEEPER